MAGGLSFWLPVIIISIATLDRTSAIAANALSLLGLVLLGFLCKIFKMEPLKWSWVLAGIYILGPISMLVPSIFVQSPKHIPGEKIWTILFCLFPPMTLWIALLNGMIVSVLIATVTLPFLAVYQRGRGLRPGSPVSR
jgi:hypothetical protein